MCAGIPVAMDGTSRHGTATWPGARYALASQSDLGGGGACAYAETARTIAVKVFIVRARKIGDFFYM